MFQFRLYRHFIARLSDLPILPPICRNIHLPPLNCISTSGTPLRRVTVTIQSRYFRLRYRLRSRFEELSFIMPSYLRR